MCMIAVAGGGPAICADGGAKVSYLIDSVPEGYHLYDCDDCGVMGRQPHVLMDDSYAWTFNTSDTDADLKQRSAVFSYKQINMLYEGLDPKLSYVLAVTYASDHVYNRVQSLWADGIQLHEPYALPKAKAIRLIVKVPVEVTSDGKMKLEIKIHGEVNATCSIVELWANGPPPVSLRLGPVSGLTTGLAGRVLDLAYDPAPGARVRLSRPGETEPLAETTTKPDGSYSFPRSAFEKLAKADLEVTATTERYEARVVIPADQLFFEPVRYRPMPVQTAGLKSNVVSLDGEWRINPAPEGEPRKQLLDGPGWRRINVPGQWLQQGFDIPQDKTAAMAREFTIPREWKGHRIFLRFDAIHAGTTYRLNGTKLGYSENLFTPVEWEITDAAKPGFTNRLDLEMKVETVSEKLSFSSGYAFHSLGGIDRSVRIYALPPVHIKDLHIDAGLDRDYRDGELRLRFTVDGDAKDLSLAVRLFDSDGSAIGHSTSSARIKAPGKPVEVESHVPNPLKWNAEKPSLYKLVLELKQGSEVLERIERMIGFRRIEIKDRQLCVNGVRVKLAGACRHEIDPSTGRADTARHAAEDVRLIKGANLNYIRTSHYPPCRELLDEADKQGIYVEVEAPFCWVAPSDELADVREVLTPTSAMVDYCHSHASVIIWSIANESHFNPVFAVSNDMVKSLDPTRPTTFNHPMSNEDTCDIANRHYPGMPYDSVLKDDPRPLILGEYFFPVCHEQTDVRIDPGLRELWGHGHADPDSDYAKECAKSFDTGRLMPGAKPGFWSHIYNSKQLVGGVIWAAFDEPFYFANGKHCGYAWVHGFWGIIDAWRRPKPEYYLAKRIFSPVWFPKRQVDFKPGQTVVRVPVENRYSFTDLSEMRFEWSVGGKRGTIKAEVAPGSEGWIEIPVPPGTREGAKMLLQVAGKDGVLVDELAVRLGEGKRKLPPGPGAGAPKLLDDGKTVTVEGKGFALVLDKATGELVVSDPRCKSPVTAFPSLHATRFDFGDLAGPNSPPYAVFPDAKAPKVESVEVRPRPDALEIEVKDRYDLFEGTMRWVIDLKGVGKVSYDYTYTGEDMNAREIGVRFLLKPECDEIRWRRWSEWDVFPEDSISRTEGSAKARRNPKCGKMSENGKPGWPWKLDQTELGTNDFRSAKFNIYEAALVAPGGSGLRVFANADAHVRPCLAENGVLLHVLSICRLGPTVIKKGDRIKGEFVVELTR